MQPDLFSALVPPCGDCHQLGKPIDSGIRYCWGEMSWRWAEDRVERCVYRDKPSQALQPATTTRTEALRDLLESPRHSISEKDRKWLRAELRREEKAGSMSGQGPTKRTGGPNNPGMKS